jgi:major membrane immunogen (membrane-anchored lipoprotein)
MLRNLKIKAITTMIVLVVFLVGCSGGSYRTIMSMENTTANSTEMSYSSFKGSKFISQRLKSGDELSLNVEVVTKEGSLTITLTDENNKELFKTENPKESIKEKIKIDKDSTYKIKVEGNHKGSYKITWDVTSSK